MTRLGISMAAVVIATTPLVAAERLVCYVSVGGEKRLATYPIDPATGQLGEPISQVLNGAPGSLAIDAKGQRLYAALRNTKQIETLQIDPANGLPSSLKTTPAVENPVYLTPAPGGRFLLSAYYTGDKVAVFPIGDNGVLGEAVQVVDTGKNPHSILPGPTGKFVYVPNTGADQILVFPFDATAGKLGSPMNVATTAGAGPRHLRFHPTLPVLYVVNEKNSSVTVYAVASDGGLSAIQTLSTLPEGFSGRNTCADIEVTPDGKYVYASNRGHDSLAGYAVEGSTGKLTALAPTPTEKTPREFAIDPSGKYVYAAGESSGQLACYTLDGATGQLTRFATVKVGKGPAWVHVQRLGE